MDNTYKMADEIHQQKAKRTCVSCGKTLRVIGAERKNGKKIWNETGKDWISRKYHKKCMPR